MTRSNKLWAVVTIMLTFTLALWAFGQCVGTREASAAPAERTYGVRTVERSTIRTWSRSETHGRCIYHRVTNENLICLYQRVDWRWQYNYDNHRAQFVSVDWNKWVWRDNALSNWWNFKSWDGSASRSGTKPSAGENLQWREREIWATMEYCILSVGCTNSKQLYVSQHVENYGDGGYRASSAG